MKDLNDYLNSPNVRIGAVGIGGPNGPGIVGIANGGGVGFMATVGDDETISIARDLEMELGKAVPSEARVKTLFTNLKNLGLAWPLFANLANTIVEKMPQLKVWVEQMLK